MSSYDTHLKEQLKKEKKKAETDNAAYEADNEALKKQTFSTLEQSADVAAGVYRQGIEDAPLESRALYDQNAMREVIDRKQIQESLANMGMTDSGISSSMQTALAVQKSRADNQVRADEQARIHEMENAIDQIYANMELEKASQGLAIDQDTAAYKRNRLQAAETQAIQTATSLYNTEVEAATKANEQALDYQKNRAELAQSYIKDGVSVSEAWGQAYAAYPDTSTAEGVRYAYYKKLREEGYGHSYANAMAKAYIDVVLAKGTDAQLSEAVSEAIANTAKKKATSVGITTWAVAGAATDIGVKDTATANLQKVAAAQISNEEKMQIVAYMTGSAYYQQVVKGEAAVQNQVGQALEANFDGIYLEIALACAGLEYK